MKNNIVLSISILMSGRKETRKCLESIKPILDQVKSELILVDTGCDEENLSILREYTDIIIPFEWCKDFSKARNVGLSQAKGEWFMFLDDDEWFYDVTPIIDFFNSGEYKAYNSATYRQRNYLEYDESSWSDAYVTRMIKKDDGVEFKSSIHEYLYPFCSPIKMLDCYVKHFGYLFPTVEEKYKHSKRNVELLLDMMEIEPFNTRWDLQILQEYMGIEEYNEVIRIGKEAINKIKEQKEVFEKKMLDLGPIYGYVVKAYACKYEWNNVEKYAFELIEDGNLTAVAKAYMLFYIAQMHYYKEEYDKCIDAVDKYWELYERLGTNSEQIFLQSSLILQTTFDKEMLDGILYYGILSGINKGEREVVISYLKKINWEKSSILLYKNFTERIVEYLAEAQYDEYFTDFVKSMVLDDKLQLYISDIIKKYEKNILSDYVSNDLEDLERFNRLVKIFSNIDGNNWYFTYLKILNEDLTSNRKPLEELYRALFSKVTDIFNINDRLWQIVDRYNLDIISIFDEIDFNRWQLGIDNWICHTDIRVIDSVHNHLNKWLGERQNLSFKYKYLYMKIYEGKLYCVYKNDEQFDEEVEDKDINNDDVLEVECISYNILELEEIFTEFINKTVEYYQSIYKTEIFINNVEILPIQCRFAFDLQKVIEQRKNMVNNIEKEKEILIQIKNFAEKYENFAKVLDIYAKLIVKSVEEQENKSINQENINKEMLQLASALKIKAREFIEQGNDEQAVRILQQVIMYVPTDTEAKEIMMMIEE